MKKKQSLSKWLSTYHPHPGEAFYQKMGNAPWNQKGNKMIHRSNHPARLAWQIAIGTLLVLALLGLGIPGVRASLSAWIGLSVAPSNQMPASAVTLAVASSPTQTITALPTWTALPVAATALTSAAPIESATPTQPAPSKEQPAEIAQLSAQAGWAILSPGRLPDGYAYQSAYLDTNHQMAILTYLVTRPLPGASDSSLTASKTITLLEALKNDFVPMQVAPATKVEDTLVNGQPAVYAIGAWDAEFVKDDKDPNGGKMVSTWRNNLAVQNLYWQVGKVFLVLVTDDEVVSKQDLLDMAESIATAQ